MVRRVRHERMQNIFIGTSGWTYADWQGHFYPDHLPAQQRLNFYTQHFNTLEINASFYRLPSPAMIRSWNNQLPADFHLVLKGWRLITHFKKIANCQESVQQFLEVVLPLHTLKIILWQLPPFLSKNIKLLQAFLDWLPNQVRHAVEFRHVSWWDEDVVKVLQDHGVAFVAISHPRLPNLIFPTTNFIYTRFHGLGPYLYHYLYSRSELADWAERLRPAIERGQTLYTFFNNDYHAHAPRNAKELQALLL